MRNVEGGKFKQRAERKKKVKDEGLRREKIEDLKI
jgi:hypothetical protein